MGRHKGGKNRIWTTEEKLLIVKKVVDDRRTTLSVSEEENISNGMLNNWLKKYFDFGEEGLVNKNRGRKPNSITRKSKDLSREEELELENMKLRIENERLKKGYTVKGDGQEKQFITINKKNLKL